MYACSVFFGLTATNLCFLKAAAGLRIEDKTHRMSHLYLQRRGALLFTLVIAVVPSVTAFQPALELGSFRNRRVNCKVSKLRKSTRSEFRMIQTSPEARGSGFSTVAHTDYSDAMLSKASQIALVCHRRQISCAGILSAIFVWLSCASMQVKFLNTQALAHDSIVNVRGDERHWTARSFSGRIQVAAVDTSLAAQQPILVAEASQQGISIIGNPRDLALKVGFVLLASIPLGIVAAVLLVGGFSLGGVWGGLGMVVGAFLAVTRFVPRVQRLRFRLDDFLNSDFAKIFDFWKLLDSALDRDSTTTGGGYKVEKMTAEKEGKLPAADPMWTAMNQDLWGAQQRISELESELLALREENAGLRAQLAEAAVAESRVPPEGESRQSDAA